MKIRDAQREMRSAFLGGFVGQLVSAIIWLGAAILGTWGAPRQAIVMLVVAGIFIFPLTKVGLRVIGRPGSVGRENSLYTLGSQVAIVLPLSLPLVGAATLHRIEWFFPAFMIAVGAHYLPFTFLYGMKMFTAVALTLWLGGLGLGLWITAPFATGAWLTAMVLFVAAIAGRQLTLREENQPRPADPTTADS